MSLTSEQRACQPPTPPEGSLRERALAAWQADEARREAERREREAELNRGLQLRLSDACWAYLQLPVKPEDVQITRLDADTGYAWIDGEPGVMLYNGRFVPFTRCRECGGFVTGPEITGLATVGRFLSTSHSALCGDCLKQADPFKDPSPAEMTDSLGLCPLELAEVAQVLANDALQSGKIVDLIEAASAFGDVRKVLDNPLSAKALTSEGVKACRCAKVLEGQFTALAAQVATYTYAQQYLVPHTPGETDPRLALSAFAAARALWSAQVESEGAL